MKYRIAVIGATGNVGHETLQILAERQFPIETIYAVASDRSAGQQISFGEEKILKVLPLSGFDFATVDLAFFCTDTTVSEAYIPKACAAGCKVIDKSSAFRMQADVPLVVPEINGDYIHSAVRHLVANPNCVTIPLTLALKPLHEAVGIKRVVVSTYQSVSGAGKEAMDELYQQIRAILVNQAVEVQHLQKQIAFNLIPFIGGSEANGFTGEEAKIMAETQKIVDADIKIVVTSVRVPVFIGHSMSVTVEFQHALSATDARLLLMKAKGILVVDRVEEELFATPLDVVGEDVAASSRIRTDPTVAHGLVFWITCDNLRKGAALNSVQIAEQWLGVPH